jgi:adenylate cyclase class IV
VRQIEIKLRWSDHEAVLARALEAGARDEGLLVQRDQFYGVSKGRLKLRTIADVRGELIAYDREDAAAARASDYGLYPTGAAALLDEVLSRALTKAGVLEKTRHLLIFRNTRIHLDDVVGLGRFVELETVIQDQSESDAVAEHDEVITVLGLGDAERIAVGYMDLTKTKEAS